MGWPNEIKELTTSTKKPADLLICVGLRPKLRNKSKLFSIHLSPAHKNANTAKTSGVPSAFAYNQKIGVSRFYPFVNRRRRS
jgi:hypothetical protein